MAGKQFISFILLLSGLSLYGQSTYRYIDPCTGQQKTINLPPNGTGTIMNYAGQTRIFTWAELQAGAYEAWVASINAQFPPGVDPCAGQGETVTNDFNTQLGSQSANNVASITGIVSMAASMGSSMSGAASTAGGVGSSMSGGSSSSGGSNSNDNGEGGEGGEGGSNNSGSNNSGGSKPPSGGSGGNSGGNSGGGSTGGSGNGGGSNGGGNAGGGSSGGSNGGSQGQPSSEGTPNTEGSTTSEGGGTSQTNASATGGESESSDGGGGGGSSGGNKSKSKQEKVGRGALIGAGDIVIIRNSGDISESGVDNYKINVSMTHLNTKQTFIKGVNVNYQTGENVTNVTLYGSLKKNGYMGIFSNSFMTNFKTDWFNTASLLNAQKTGPVTWMLGGNYTYGYLGKGNFQNFSLVGGGFTNFKGGKTIGANVLLLSVYSPYIFYYEGQWYKSGFLMVPMLNTDFKLTDKFKWSISFAGVYQLNQSVLNWQLMTGTKILL